MVGPQTQQDVELCALYRDSVITYGDSKVLGILATRTTEHEHDHDIRKRAATEENPENPDKQSNQANNPSTPNQANSEPATTNDDDCVFYPTIKQPYNILLYTSKPPVLSDGKKSTTLVNDVSLTITTNSRGNEQRTLKVRYNYKERERVCVHPQ